MPRLNLSASWNALLHGAVVAHVVFEQPEITFGGGVQNLFKNQGEHQFATRATIHGNVENKDIGTRKAIITVLRNAFVEAFRSTFEKLPEKRD